MTGLIPVFGSRFEQYAMSQPLTAIAHLVSMVSSGLFARYPDVRVAFLEAGLSWFTHIVLRMDKEYNENRRDIPYFTDRPSKYLRRQVWLGTHPLEARQPPDDLGALVAIASGTDRLLFGSHWPYPDRDAAGRVAACFPDAADRQRVLGGNAAELFAPIADVRARTGATQTRTA
jgi:predicted TIM-barrel fold metal-dependent hydrolase